LKKEIHDAIYNHYTELFQNHGIKPASLGWPKGRQKLRFKIMSEIGEIKNSKVLDIGCGFGDFLTYLNVKKRNVEYTGIDINPIFIKIAKSIHSNGSFLKRDIEITKFSKKFDWSFAIGTTNMKGNYDYVEDLMKEMLRISKKGIAMDFMSSYVDFKRKGSSHFKPEKIFKIAKKLSKRVVIRHDYLPFEFCVYIYKNSALMKNQTFKDLSRI
jgi:ubiquinone/menaquinone biosynthesis C-methylase UbiE